MKTILLLLVALLVLDFCLILLFLSGKCSRGNRFEQFWLQLNPDR